MVSFVAASSYLSLGTAVATLYCHRVVCGSDVCSDLVLERVRLSA